LTTSRSHQPRAPRPLRRFTRWGGGLAFVVVALSACQASNLPPGYNDTTKSSFMETCTGGVPPIDGTTTTIAPTDYCTCAYGVFVAQVPYDDKAKESVPGYSGPSYVTLNSELQNDANKLDTLPDPVKAALKACRGENVTSGSTPPGSTPGTTVAGTPGTAAGTTPGTNPPA
jgi:hypothetical protein